MTKITKYVNGQILSEQKGKFHHFYFENGAIQKVGVLNGEICEGEWKFYRKNGKLWQIGSYESGQKVGLWKRYNSNGDVAFEKMHKKT